MKETIKYLNAVDFNCIWMPENGNKPEEWKKFCRIFKKELTKVLKGLKCDKIEINNNYFEISVFFTSPNNQPYFLHLSDVRWFKGSVYFRTARDYKDYRGGANYNTTLENLKEDLERNIR